MAVETVQFCPFCQTKTWFVDGVCEWSDGHAVMQQAPPGASGAEADARLTPHAT